MKLLLLTSLIPLAACTNSFRAQSSDTAGKKRTPVVTVTMNNADTLPLCTKAVEGMNVFLAKDATMYVCQRGDWMAANPQKAEWGFAARGSVRYNQWEDLHTRKRWSIAPARTDVVNSCSSGWRLPIRSELLTASQHGLFEGIKANGGVAFGRAWALEGKDQKVAVIISHSSREDENPGVYCVLDT